MGSGAIISLLVLVVSIPIGIKFVSFFDVPPVPKLEETWWGPGTKGSEDVGIRPFKITVPDEVISDLNIRLRNTRALVPPLENAKHSYGITSTLTKNVLDFWLNKYSWKKREQFLNQYPQFKTKIQGLDIHFLHVKPKDSKGLKVYPLLLIHGWPGSVREFYEIIPHLTTPQKGRKVVFEVIAPSIPGYGFSEAAVRPGLGAVQVAVIFKNLMNRLKLNHYYVQGGDWGSIIANHIATLYPQNVIGLHSNLCFNDMPIGYLKKAVYSLKPSLIVEKKYEHLVYPMSTIYGNLILESGYMHIQATKPDTLGTALSDSPAGLASYILEKFITWTNPKYKEREDGGLTEKYKMEDLLDNIMIYWITGTITTSMRLYSESFSTAQTSLQLAKIPVPVPSGCSRFIHDILYTPTGLLEDKYPKLLHVTDHEAGHFAAFEVPEVLAQDIYDFSEKVLSLALNK
ncbi:juvenile hormone epoxide hydrolase 1-like isoform X1 [Harmonia axyridis]|uniref:juvenile hormone epoxide hydrolase 1-like isoform X1 n=1 Tax=Harmonia axyridis TaxID=115357 RepID=UPI001E276164|nr:juvenile hormone epoxide hydrolase 1-like isoform X1 [Harmonia axyridis]